MRIMNRYRGLSTAQIWPLIVLAGFGFFVSLVPVAPNDFWWHLKIGQLIFDEGRIPTTNLFAWTLPADFPFSYGAWLGEYLLYVLYRWGGLALVIFTRSALFITTLWLVALEARRRSGSWRLAALAIAVVGGCTLNNLAVRPQIWSWLPFLAFWMILNRVSAGSLKQAWLLLLAPVMMFWVNVHGAFVLGIVLLGIFFVGALIQMLFTPAAAARSWKPLLWLGGAGLATALAMVVNPKGLGIMAYVVDLMTDRPSQNLIEEWQSPTPNGVANIVFFIVILLLLVVFAYSQYRPTMVDSLSLVGFLWLAWSGQRYVIWFVIVAAPILTQAISKLPIRIPPLQPHHSWVNLALAIGLFIPLLFAQPWFVESLPLPPSYWEMVQRGSPAGPLVDVATPIKAAAYLRKHPGGKLYNEMGYGSYLIWAVPEQGVFIDPRVELYPFEQWQDYIHINRGVRYNELLQRYGANRLLLDKSLQKDLIALLTNDPSWRIEYEDEHSQLWTRLQTNPQH